MSFFNNMHVITAGGDIAVFYLKFRIDFKIEQYVIGKRDFTIFHFEMSFGFLLCFRGWFRACTQPMRDVVTK